MLWHWLGTNTTWLGLGKDHVLVSNNCFGCHKGSRTCADSLSEKKKKKKKEEEEKKLLSQQTQLEFVKVSYKKDVFYCCHTHGWKLLVGLFFFLTTVLQTTTDSRENHHSFQWPSWGTMTRGVFCWFQAVASPLDATKSHNTRLFESGNASYFELQIWHYLFWLSTCSSFPLNALVCHCNPDGPYSRSLDCEDTHQSQPHQPQLSGPHFHRNNSD